MTQGECVAIDADNRDSSKTIQYRFGMTTQSEGSVNDDRSWY
jgi:hypothetical protein